MYRSKKSNSWRYNDNGTFFWHVWFNNLNYMQWATIFYGVGGIMNFWKYLDNIFVTPLLDNHEAHLPNLNDKKHAKFLKYNWKEIAQLI